MQDCSTIFLKLSDLPSALSNDRYPIFREGVMPENESVDLKVCNDGEVVRWISPAELSRINRNLYNLYGFVDENVVQTGPCWLGAKCVIGRDPGLVGVQTLPDIEIVGPGAIFSGRRHRGVVGIHIEIAHDDHRVRMFSLGDLLCKQIHAVQARVLRLMVQMQVVHIKTFTRIFFGQPDPGADARVFIPPVF